jgi:hypothetical protein
MTVVARGALARFRPWMRGILSTLGMACATGAFGADSAAPQPAPAAAPANPQDPQGPTAVAPAPAPAAHSGRTLRHGAAATMSLMTLEAKGKDGRSDFKPYSELNYGLGFDAMLWSELFSEKVGLGFFADAQALSFDESKDGRLAATGLTTYAYGVSLLIEPYPGLVVGPLVGSTSDPQLIEQAGGTVEIVVAEAMLYGIALGYSHRVGEAWRLEGGAEQYYMTAAKAKGVEVEEGAGYALSITLRRDVDQRSHVSIGYRLSQERQDSAQSELTRGADLVAVGFGSSVDL